MRNKKNILDALPGLLIVVLLFLSYIGPSLYLEFVDTPFKLLKEPEQITKIEIFFRKDNADRNDAFGEFAKEIPDNLHDDFASDLESLRCKSVNPPDKYWGRVQIKIEYSDGTYEIVFENGRYINENFSGMRRFDKADFKNLLDKYDIDVDF